MNKTEKKILSETKFEDKQLYLYKNELYVETSNNVLGNSSVSIQIPAFQSARGT